MASTSLSPAPRAERTGPEILKGDGCVTTPAATEVGASFCDLLEKRIAGTVRFQCLAAEARARRGKAAPGLRLDNGKDNDVQKTNILFLFQKFIALVIVQSAKLQKPSRKLPKRPSNP